MVIREGEIGDKFYMIIEGEAIATKTLEAGKAPQQVMEYKAGDYFGERALLTNDARAANIEAKSAELVVASLERDTFKRLLGPLDSILKKNMDLYGQFAAKK